MAQGLKRYAGRLCPVEGLGMTNDLAFVELHSQRLAHCQFKPPWSRWLVKAATSFDYHLTQGAKCRTYEWTPEAQSEYCGGRIQDAEEGCYNDVARLEIDLDVLVPDIPGVEQDARSEGREEGPDPRLITRVLEIASDHERRTLAQPRKRLDEPLQVFIWLA